MGPASGKQLWREIRQAWPRGPQAMGGGGRRVPSECGPGSRHFRTFHHPTYGSCYTFNGTWTVHRPGITHGISLVLRAEQQDALPLLSTEAGIKVMVHRRDHTPFLEHRGFSVRPGTETTIGIREACLVSCFQQLMVNTCSCGYYFFPLPAGAEYCNSARHPAWGHCFYRLYRKLETHRLPCASRCPRPCRESSYKLSAGSARWPSSTSGDWILAVLGKRSPPRPGQSRSPAWSPRPRSNVAKVNIFYQELNCRTADETPVYSVPQLLSAMGSLWSLWFGSSVLSVLELLELLIDAVALALLLGCHRLRRVRGSQPRAHTKPETSPEPRDRGHEAPPGALAGISVKS